MPFVLVLLLPYLLFYLFYFRRANLSEHKRRGLHGRRSSVPPFPLSFVGEIPSRFKQASGLGQLSYE